MYCTVKCVASTFIMLIFLNGSDNAKLNVKTSSDGTNYLIKYGYLVPQDPKTGALRSEESLKEAIRQFQRLAGLPVTGDLDDNTKKMMSLPRCGVPDNIGIGRKSKRKKRYALQGSKWAKTNLTYRITEFSPDLDKRQTEIEVDRALKVWSAVTPLRFTRKPTGSVDIEVKFVRREHGDGNPFDGRGRTLAHAFFPQYGGDAHFDEEEPWTVAVPNGVNLFQVAAHEFGHSLGLAHSDVSNALMAPFYRGFQRSFTLDPDDVGAIQELYGPPNNVKPGIHPEPPKALPTPRDPQITIPSICRSPDFDSITQNADGFTYIFKGKFYYRLNGYGIDTGFPRRISMDWKGVEGPIDAALHWDNGYTFLFKGENYWKFYNFRLIYARKISEGFRGVPNNIEAAFVWGGNGKTYFIKGNEYWRYSDNRVDSRYPKPMSVWRGIPNGINSAFKWKNGRTYFFNGPQYYRFHDSNFRVDEDYPRGVGNWWLGCPAQSQIDHFDSLKKNRGADLFVNHGNTLNEEDVASDQFLSVGTAAINSGDGTNIPRSVIASFLLMAITITLENS